VKIGWLTDCWLRKFQTTLVEPPPCYPTGKKLRALLMEISGINPFECPICFESYSAVNVPTTLPCGHSCCIIHAGSLSQCFACRMDIGDARSLRPSYALRDGSILFFSLCDNPEGVMTGAMDKIMSIPRNDSIPPDQKVSADMRQECYSSPPSAPPLPQSYPLKSSPAPAPAPAPEPRVPRLRTQILIDYPSHPFRCPNVGCTISCKSQIKLDRHLTHCPNPPPPPPLIHCPNPGCEVGCRTQQKLESHMTSCPFRPRPAPPTRRSLFQRVFGFSQAEVPAAPPSPARSISTFKTIKGCGHRCSPSSLPACCRCMDRRPMQAEGTYPRYVDGEGWKNIGLRREGYCPNCK
jgi:hypothetical protein